jgi:ankyrin repeat protein
MNYNTAFTDDLQTAIQNSDYNKIVKLLDAGVNPNTILKAGDTLLTWAVKHKAQKLIEVLLKRGADVNMPSLSGYTPLNLAFPRLTDETILLIINQGVNWRYLDAKKYTYFENAMIHNRINVLRHMLRYEELVQSVINKDVLSMEFIYYWCDGMEDIIERLISCGYRLRTDYQLLHAAVFENKYNAVKWLLDYGFSPTDKKDSDETPLEAALSRQHGLRILEGTEEDLKESERIIELLEERILQETKKLKK